VEIPNYTGENIEHGNHASYNFPKKWTKLDNSNSSNMVKSKCNSSVEFLQMQEKIKELEKALVNSELRATAYETMIEIAEKELKINIRKKSNTKPSIR
jgi:transposase